MKFKAVLSGINTAINPAIVKAMSSSQLAKKLIELVSGKCLGAANPLFRPSEYYMQWPDMAVAAIDGTMGVEMRLTGVSRDGREPKQFHEALRVLHEVTKDTLKQAMEESGCRESIQLFTAIMLDGEVPVDPKSGLYSNILEHPAEWIKAGADDSCAGSQVPNE
ncbi:MAG: hypothetical protein M1338_00505 [Patescibacteria group bacterium]|nr:hypothetical protein [Patescibacteria group bacterium]